MCVVSMISDYYEDKFKKAWGDKLPNQWPLLPGQPIGPTQEEFDALKKEVEDMKALLKKAKIYDVENDQNECEMEEKISLLKKIADLVDIDLDEIFGKQ